MERQRKIARRNIRKLLDLALKLFHEDRKLAKRYVDLALKISMKTRTRIPREYRHLICRGCKSLMIPNFNCRVRLQKRREPHVVITCLECGRVKRYIVRRSDEKRPYK